MASKTWSEPVCTQEKSFWRFGNFHIKFFVGENKVVEIFLCQVVCLYIVYFLTILVIVKL